MLKDAKVKMRQDKTIKVTDLSEIKDKFDTNLKKGGRITIEVLAYHPPTKKFTFQTPTAVIPVNMVSKVMAIELDLGEGKTHTSYIDVTTKVLVESNGVPTSILVGALSNLTGPGVRVAYVHKWDNSMELKDSTPEITYHPIKRVYDPVDEAKKKIDQDKKVEAAKKDAKTEGIKLSDAEPKKRGRPKKENRDREMLEHPKEVLRLESKDGSLFVCDHLIIK